MLMISAVIDKLKGIIIGFVLAVFSGITTASAQMVALYGAPVDNPPIQGLYGMMIDTPQMTVWGVFKVLWLPAVIILAFVVGLAMVIIKIRRRHKRRLNVQKNSQNRPA